LTHSRRAFLRDLAGVVLTVAVGPAAGACTPAPAPAQRAPARVYRVGVIKTNTDLPGSLWERLNELGYEEGRNLIGSTHLGVAGDSEDVAQGRADQAAVDMAHVPVDVIVVQGGPATDAALKATSAIPIVLMGLAPPNLAPMDNMARPSGNVTGVVRPTANLFLKRLQLLVEAAPEMTRILVLGGLPSLSSDELDAAVTALGLSYMRTEQISASDELEAIFARAVDDGVNGLFVGVGSVNAIWGDQVVALAERYRLPASYNNGRLVDRGGLMTYEPRESEVQRDTADYVDRILRGAHPADLPMRLATGYDLIVNVRAAHAIGLTLPQAFLAQADEVIG